MNIELGISSKFKDLDVGDFFFLDNDLFLKIVEEEGYNAVGLTETQNEKPALHYFPSNTLCSYTSGKIVIG